MVTGYIRVATEAQLRTRVVGYVRVSTEEQARDGVSLETQERKIRGLCKLHEDLDLVDLVIDAGESAKTLRRPGIQRVLGMLDRGEASGVVIAALDRITRNVRDWNALIDGYFGEKPNKRLISVSDSIDTRTAAGRMVINILVVVAQWQREYIVERTTQALAHKRDDGQRVGPIPYGFELNPQGRKAGDGRLLDLRPKADEQEILGWIVSYASRGMSAVKIAAELNQLDVPTKQRKGPWRHNAVGKILKRLPKPGAPNAPETGQDAPHDDQQSVA